jgi:putative SOS response-associated peptidase YedK
MCNEYARRKSLENLREEFSQTRLPNFEWYENLIPNDLDGKASVKISDTAPIMRLRNDKLVGSMTPWAWNGAHGKPVFNFVSEGRDFTHSDRVLVFADGFYEFTKPQQAKVKLKDKHLFELKGEDWFWIAGIVKQGCFSLLTTEPGPDLAPYHDRQIVILRPSAGLYWLNLSRPSSELLLAPPAGSLRVTTVRKDGEMVAASSGAPSARPAMSRAFMK